MAVTEALLLKVNVQVLVLLPPLEQAPDQIASRLLLTRSVMAVPTLNVADPVDGTRTVIPESFQTLNDLRRADRRQTGHDPRSGGHFTMARDSIRIIKILRNAP